MENPEPLLNWERLRELRQIFLGERQEGQDYWDSSETLDCYDQTFAQRIGWKWDFVLSEIKKSGWGPENDSIVCDLACGSGIAGRSFLYEHDHSLIRAIHYSDRSTLAKEYAESRHEESFPSIPVTPYFPEKDAFYLISHIGTEISESDIEKILTTLKQKAYGFIWVEPGAFGTGRLLSQVRDKLLGDFNPWAPCPNSLSCPVLLPGYWEDWCHQFAKPPSNIFQDSFWARFSKELKVDLRSLPVSFLCMDKRLPENEKGLGRFLGRPKVNKFQVEMQTCFDGHLDQLCIRKRNQPKLYKAFKKGDFESLSPITENDGEIGLSSDSCDRKN